jgi:signal transduction histidine kinase
MALTPGPSRIELAPALQFLLDASAALLRASDQHSTLSSILDVAGQVLAADAYAVWRETDGHGNWQAVATRGLSASYRTSFRSGNVAIPPHLMVYEDVEHDPKLANRRGDLAAEQICRMIAAPLTLIDGCSGTITFYWRTVGKFSQHDLDYASALSNFAAAALNQQTLQAQSKREKDRLRFLSEASSVLSSSIDYEATLQQVAGLAVPGMADWCVVHVIENGVPTRVVTAHADPAMLELARDFAQKYPEEIHPERGLGAVLRTGKTEVYEHISDEMLVASARSPEHLTDIRSLGLTSSILVALRSRDKVLGALRLLAAGSGRYFSDSDIQLAEDLARRAAAAIENAQLHRAILRAEKLSAAGRLAATVAHEVNNPLEALTNLVYLSAAADNLPEEVREHLLLAEAELRRIAHIVRQTLGFYRETATPQLVDLATIAEESLALYRGRAESRSIRLALTEAETVTVRGNSGELKQVITNLLSNALDATPALGSVEVRVHRSGPHAVLEVRDTGSGIEPAHIEHLFEPFFTTKADVGTGLGLWVAKGIIDKQGGSIEITTNPGEGTAFTVTLPLINA